MKWLSRLRKGKQQEVVPSQGEEELLAALSSRSYEQISPALQRRCKASKGSHNPEMILAAARECGWSEAEIKKLEILAEYYGGDVRLAFDAAKDFATGDNFDPDLFLISIISLYRDNQFEEARRFLERIPTNDPRVIDRADYWLINALVCWATADMTAVDIAVKRMLELAPNDGTVLENAFGMAIELGDLALIDRIGKAFETGQFQRGYSYSLCLLALGDKLSGLRWMESRYEMFEASRFFNKALFGFPRWQGEQFSGRTLLLSAEQGLGDTIQMARYLPILQKETDGLMILESQPETISLLQYNFPEIKIVVREYAKVPAQSFDVWIGMLSLPLYVGREGLVPGKAGYLNVPPETLDYWHSRVAELTARQRPRIGITWSGQPKHRADKRRSVPFGKIADAVRALDADFFALQTSVPEVIPSNMINVSDEMLTLADTAALIAEMDLVVSVDTSVVHLAGALGKKTWLLLPYRYEWRWGLEGESNDWYDSVRVIRQLRHGAWDELLGRVFGEMLQDEFKYRGK